MKLRILGPAGLAIGIILLMFIPQVPGCVMANTPKVGRVVDESTGKGLANATVIASATFNAQQPIHGSAHDMPFRVLTRTDQDGNYYIPNTWIHLRFALPGMDARESWVITVYKPGFVVAGDEENLRKFRSTGENKYRAKSTVESPPGMWLGLVVQVSPISMRQAQLSLKEAATYYRDVLGAGLYSQQWGDQSEVALRAEAYKIFEPMVCSLGPDEVLDLNAAGAFASFAFNSVKFDLSLRTLEPSGFRDSRWHLVIHAASICKALHDSEGPHEGVAQGLRDEFRERAHVGRDCRQAQPCRQPVRVFDRELLRKSECTTDFKICALTRANGRIWHVPNLLAA